MAMKPSPVAGPLNGVTVVDLSRVLAGPYCTMVLADLGARIIKVEVPGTGDDSRHIGPFIEGKSAYFMAINRSKESIALDLKNPTDKALFERLLARADVLVENFRPGAMERLGYGWPILRERFPSLIYAAVSGFGQTGPYRDRPAYDMVVQGMGGIMSLTGQPGGQPTRVGTSVGDITAGLFAVGGITSALYHRERTGEGSMIDIGMLDCQVAILENAIARYFATGQIPGPLGARHPSITPFEAYRTADGHVIVAAGNDSLFNRLCDAIDRAELAGNPLFRTNPDRNTHVLALKDELEATFKTAPTSHWLRILEAAGVPCGPINNVKQAMEDPQIEARNMMISADDPIAGAVRLAGNPIKISAFEDPPQRQPAPELDADRDALVRELDELEAG